VEPSARDAFQATIVRKGVADAHNGDVIKIVPDSVTDGRYVLEVVTPEGSRSVVGDTAASIERAQEQALEAARLNPEFRPKSSQTETVSDPEPSPKDATVSSKPSAPATEGYQALPEKTRTLFEDALNANDDVEPTQLLHTGNKTLSAESTARTDAKLTQLGEFDASRLPGCTESPIQQHNELVYIHD
jgi:pyruvate/2-oxoglutarate dehydrogenase complex dihydrolipoamide acyltransferase (E2) component